MEIFDPSNSRVQGNLEQKILSQLENNNPKWKCSEWSEVSRHLGLPDSLCRTKPDRVWVDETTSGVWHIIAEVYMRLEPLKSGNRRKIASDLLKLLTIQRRSKPDSNLRLVMIMPKLLFDSINRESWLSEALQMVEVILVDLDDSATKQLGEAVKLQGSGQARKKVAKKAK